MPTPNDAIRELMLHNLESRLIAAWKRAGDIDGVRAEISFAQEAAIQIRAEFSRLDAKCEEIIKAERERCADRLCKACETDICNPKECTLRAAIMQDAPKI
jgi:hypothetical protein